MTVGVERPNQAMQQPLAAFTLSTTRSLQPTLRLASGRGLALAAD
jgi:hypothetical protein